MIGSLSPEGRVRAAALAPGRLTVIYDDDCALCIRCRFWLEDQPAWVPLDFMASASPEAVERYGEDLPWLGKELVVVSDRGEAWIGPAAFIVALWALRDWREWSYRLASPTFAPLAERFFRAVSDNRRAIAGYLREPECPDGSCRHRATA